MGAGSAKVGHPCTGILCLSCPPLSFCGPQQAPLCPHQLLGLTLFHFPSLGTLWHLGHPHIPEGRDKASLLWLRT